MKRDLREIDEGVHKDERGCLQAISLNDFGVCLGSNKSRLVLISGDNCGTYILPSRLILLTLKGSFVLNGFTLSENTLYYCEEFGNKLEITTGNLVLIYNEF